jgi:hypothetical protein
MARGGRGGGGGGLGHGETMLSKAGSRFETVRELHVVYLLVLRFTNHATYLSYFV